MVLRLDSSDLGSKVEIKGTLYLTTIRIVFVPSVMNTYFTAIDLPLQGITDDKFEQPIFGSNHLMGTIAPVPGRGLVNPAKFRLYFHDGGAGTFLHVYFGLMEKIHHAPRVSVTSHPPPLFTPPQMQSFMEEQQAYIDPSDPSVLYIAQPEVTQVMAPGIQPNSGVPNGGWGVPPSNNPGMYPPPTTTAVQTQYSEDPTNPTKPTPTAPPSYSSTSSSTTTIITSGIPPSQVNQLPPVNPSYANFSTTSSTQPQPNPAYYNSNSGYGPPAMIYNQQQPQQAPPNSYPPTAYPPTAYPPTGYGPPAMYAPQQPGQQPAPNSQYGNTTVIRGLF